MNKKLIILALTGAITMSSIKTTAYGATLSSNSENYNNKYEYEEVVEALTNVYVRKDTNTESDAMTLLKKGEELPLVPYFDKNFYRVKIDDDYGYISKEYSTIKQEIKMLEDMKKVIKIAKDSEINSIINATEESNIVPKNEIGEVYEETEDSYLIKTPEELGYINKENTTTLDGLTVVADISSQELKVYNDNKVILTSPIVSGKPSTPTYEGEYKIFEISHNRELVAPDKSYRSYVDVMMKFNKNEGFHDAEYHTDYNENGKAKKHGWRSLDEFGGDTYLKNGSHGCVNMPHDKAIELSKIVTKGTRVLIKK